MQLCLRSKLNAFELSILGRVAYIFHYPFPFLPTSQSQQPHKGSLSLQVVTLTHTQNLSKTARWTDLIPYNIWKELPFSVKYKSPQYNKYTNGKLQKNDPRTHCLPFTFIVIPHWRHTQRHCAHGIGNGCGHRRGSCYNLWPSSTEEVWVTAKISKLPQMTAKRSEY